MDYEISDASERLWALAAATRDLLWRSRKVMPVEAHQQLEKGSLALVYAVELMEQQQRTEAMQLESEAALGGLRTNGKDGS